MAFGKIVDLGHDLGIGARGQPRPACVIGLPPKAKDDFPVFECVGLADQTAETRMRGAHMQCIDVIVHAVLPIDVPHMLIDATQWLEGLDFVKR